MDHALALARDAADGRRNPGRRGRSRMPRALFCPPPRNRTEAEQNPTAHAEFLALRAARAARGGKYLSDCTLTVTLEPCALCAGAIAAFRIKKLVFGAYDPKSGAVEHGPRVFSHATTHHKPEIIGGVRDSDCSALLAAFFAGLRNA